MEVDGKDKRIHELKCALILMAKDLTVTTNNLLKELGLECSYGVNSEADEVAEEYVKLAKQEIALKERST